MTDVKEKPVVLSENGSLSTRTSSDSEALAAMLYNTKQHCQRRNYINKKFPQVPAAQIQTGRIVDPSDFFLCLSAMLLLSVGIGLTLVSIWSMIFNIPYGYLLDFTSELAYFSLPGAILCFPCFWIAFSMHNDSKSRGYMLLLIVLLIFSTMLVAVGIYMGLTHKLKSYRTNKFLLMADLNGTMRNSMSFYKTDINIRKSWDKIQSRLHCCGVEKADEWIARIDKFPESCCRQNETICLDQNSTTVEIVGCLERGVEESTWQLNLFTGLNCVAISLKICTLITTIIIYLMEKWKQR